MMAGLDGCSDDTITYLLLMRGVDVSFWHRSSSRLDVWVFGNGTIIGIFGIFIYLLCIVFIIQPI